MRSRHHDLPIQMGTGRVTELALAEGDAAAVARPARMGQASSSMTVGVFDYAQRSRIKRSSEALMKRSEAWWLMRRDRATGARLFLNGCY
ncbi:hypothetical protein NL676_014408 [Syzygium grande]|nr:hypothetical protein NL676_014408 [Syzygium grande]